MKRGIIGILVVGIKCAFACTTVIAGRKATSSGKVLVGHNEDFDCRRMEHSIVPPQDWPKGAYLPPMPHQAPLKQVAHTHGFYWASSISAQVAMLSNTALNEKGVFVTMNNGGKPRTEGDTKAGGVCNQVLRVIAERANSAHEGVRMAVMLLKEYGLSQGGRIWTIADSREAFVIEAVCGRHFVAARVPDDKVVLIPNALTIRAMPPGVIPESIPECELALYAEAKGWKKADESFDFAKCYQRPDWFMHPHSLMRFRLGAKVITGKAWAGECTFALTPEKPITPSLIKEVLSQHVVEGVRAHEDAVGPICRVETGEAIVCEFADAVQDTTLHTAFGSPCVYPWLPLHPLAVGVPPSLDVPDATRRLQEQVLLKPYEKPSVSNAWDQIVAAIQKISQKGPSEITAWKCVKQNLDAAALMRARERENWKSADEASVLAALRAARAFGN